MRELLLVSLLVVLCWGQTSQDYCTPNKASIGCDGSDVARAGCALVKNTWLVCPDHTFTKGDGPTGSASPNVFPVVWLVLQRISPDLQTVYNEYRAPFFPKVDEFTQLNIPNSGRALYSYYVNAGANETLASTITRIQLRVGTYSSDWRRYTDGNLFIPSFSATVTLSAGQNWGILWDEGCSDCTAALCLDSHNCGQAYSSFSLNTSIDATTAFPSATDLKVYLAWVGTDKSGTVLASAGLLPSNFRKFSVGSFYITASSAVQQSWENTNSKFADTVPQ